MIESRNGLKWLAISVALVILLLPTAVRFSMAQLTPHFNITAIVNVVCPFKVSISGNTLYILPIIRNPDFTYSVNALVSGCPIQPMSGSFYIQNNHGSNLTQQAINYPPSSNTLSISNTIFSSSPSRYIAYARFTYNNFSNSTQLSFSTLAPAVLKISNLSVTSTLTQGSLLTISQDILNNGNLTASNIVLHTTITIPGSNSIIINSTIPNVTPNSQELFEFEINNATAVLGAYKVSEYLGYYDGSNMNTSSTSKTSYTVIAQPASGGQGGGGGGLSPTTIPSPPTSISSVSLISIPILSGVLGLLDMPSYLSMQNTGQYPVWVNISAPNNLSFGSLVISSKSTYLPPNQQLNVQIYVTKSSNALAGIYIVPINVTVSQHGSLPAQETLYNIISIETKTSLPQISTGSITISNNTVFGTLEITNPLSKAIYNSTAYIDIPTTAIRRIADIQLSGAISNITTSNNLLMMEWKVPQLQPNGSVNVYYSIKNVTDPSIFINPSTEFVVPSQTKSAVKVFDIHLPSIQPNGTSPVYISAIYTGQNPGNITLSLSAPYSIIISNQSQTFYVSPNSQINAGFNVTARGDTGTYILTLQVKGRGTNDTYQLPLVVFPTQSAVPLPNGIFAAIPKTVKNFLIYILTAVLVLAAASTAIRWRMHKSRYAPSRVRRLEYIKRQVERED